jgi:hypothetical protein
MSSPPIVVLLQYGYELPCANGKEDTCSGYEIEFVSEQTGNQVLPTEQWANTTANASSGFFDEANAIGEGVLYVENGYLGVSLSAYPVPGLAIDYEVALQELAESGDN